MTSRAGRRTRLLFALPAIACSVAAVLIHGGNTQPPCRTLHPNAYGYYEIGHLLLDLGNGSLDTELWMEHPGLGLPGYAWAARYQIPLQGTMTFTDALYSMIDDATWRTRHDIRESRHPKWMPVSSMEWIFAPHTKAITDTILVGEPVFVSIL